MTTHKGIAPLMVLLIIGVLAVLGGGAYIVMNPEAAKAPVADDGIQTEPGDHPEEDHDASEGVSANAKTSISWKLADLGERDNVPFTKVTAVIGGTAYETGEYRGNCTEIGAAGGFDGKGLLAGELSAVQCSWGDDGSEIGVFAHEDGGYQIMVGALGTGEGRYPSLRGDFKIKADIKSAIPAGAL